jgi:opacity protein-like surface antigen
MKQFLVTLCLACAISAAAVLPTATQPEAPAYTPDDAADAEPNADQETQP